MTHPHNHNENAFPQRPFGRRPEGFNQAQKNLEGLARKQREMFSRNGLGQASQLRKELDSALKQYREAVINPNAEGFKQAQESLNVKANKIREAWKGSGMAEIQAKMEKLSRERKDMIDRFSANNPLRDFNNHNRGPMSAGRTPRGGIKLGLLLLIEENEASGYGLMKAFEMRTDGSWTPKPGAIYPALNQLIAEGLAVVDEKGIYELTVQGTEELEDNRELTELLFERMSNSVPIQDLSSSSRKLASALQVLESQMDNAHKAQVAEKLDALTKEVHRMLSEDS